VGRVNGHQKGLMQVIEIFSFQILPLNYGYNLFETT
jgi:hypothetical protein